MRASRCYLGPLIVLPFLVIFGFLRGLVLLPHLLGLRLLTPLLPQVEVRRQASRPFIITLLYPRAEPGIFVLLLTLAFRQYIKIYLLILSLLYCFVDFSGLALGLRGLP